MRQNSVLIWSTMFSGYWHVLIGIPSNLLVNLVDILEGKAIALYGFIGALEFFAAMHHSIQMKP